MDDRFFEVDEELLKAVLAWSYRRIVAGHDPKATARPAAELEPLMAGSITPDGIGGHEALRRFTEVVVPATRAQDDPMNLAYVPSAPTPAAMAFDLAVSAAQTFAGTWEAGAGAVHAENQALRWIADLVGWPAGAGGTFVQGATVGNLSALVAARQRAASSRTERPARWQMIATTEAHSSVSAAARVMDVDLVTVPVDDQGRMQIEALARTLDAHPDVFAVVATAGTTNAGEIDDLAGAAAACGERGVWFHVDGAYGLAAAAAPTARPEFDGIEQADSLVVDPHKWLFAPYDSCALLYRDPADAARAHAQHAGYLEHVDRREWNPSDHAIQLSRRARGLPLWFSLATYGTDRYAAAIEQVLATARQVADRIAETSHLELVLAPRLSIVLFRRPGWSEAEMGEWADAQAKAGTILCLPTRWHGELVFRLCLLSPDTRADDIMAVLESQR